MWMSKGDACDKVWKRPFKDLNKDLFPDFENNTPIKEHPTGTFQLAWVRPVGKCVAQLITT